MKNIFYIILLVASRSFSFTLNSTSNSNLKGWANTDVKLYVNTANCPASVDVVSIIKDAVSVWNNIPSSSIKVSYGGATTSTTMSDPPTVYCETNFQGVVGADENYVPGAGAVNGSSGQITAGLLYLNASTGQGNIGNFPRTILTIVLAHEIGHILGLGHSADTAALMYYDASNKQQLKLAQDDIDGMTYLYPQSDLGLNNLAGCGLIRTPRPPNGFEILTLFALLLLPFAVGVVLRKPQRLVKL